MAAKVDADATAPGVFSLKKGKRAFFCVSCNKARMTGRKRERQS